ncbi:MAG: hypothetical protein WBO04_05855 [Steroidobacteraceae bacterium]
MSHRRHLLWLVAALAFGALVLPFLVYYTGSAVLGPYAHGGPGSFLRDYFVDLAGMRGSAWTLLLGPAGLVLVWRMLVAYAWRTGED